MLDKAVDRSASLARLEVVPGTFLPLAAAARHYALVDLVSWRALARAMGRSFSAEQGIGHLKVCPIGAGKSEVDPMARVERAIDPDRRLSPGKVALGGPAI